MGLESLLARLEHLEHQGTRDGVPGKPLQNKPGTPGTPRTPEIQARRPDISTPDLAALAHPDALWWRIAIHEPGRRTIEVDTPSGWTLPDWQAYAARYYPAGSTVTPIAELPKPSGPVNIEKVLAAACGACDPSVGITPVQFRSLLSPEDVADIEAGCIHRKTLRAYAGSLAEGIRSGRIVVREGAKPEAPASGSIVITDAEIEAARKGQLVVRQGDFTGAPEVKP